MRPLPLLLFLLGVGLFVGTAWLTGPIRLWTGLIGLFYIVRSLTWQRALAKGLRPSLGRQLAFAFLWAGTDAEQFLDAARTPPRPPPSAWLAAVLKIAFGALLFYVIAPRVGSPTVLRAWLGLTGLGFMVFFGLFHLMQVIWCHLGVDAERLWVRPLYAHAPSDFWGRRWNLAFRRFAYTWIFRPLVRKLGVRGAVFCVFLFSGIAHEGVCSYTAGGGYGLPTLYFLIQFAAVATEKSALGKRLGIDRGARGWWFTLVTAGFTAGLLFHAPFMDTLLLPMLP